MKIKNKIGSLRNRIEQRIGRPFGRCDSCAKPTRSHKVGGGLVCHDCHTPHQQRLVTDGGWEADKQEQQTPIGGDEIPETMQQRDEWFNFVLELKGTDDGERKIDKRPVAPYSYGKLKYASWINKKEEDRTDFETAKKYTEYSPKEIGWLNDRTQIKLAEKKIGLGYPIAKPDHRDPSESVTLIDLDDVRKPDDGALHPRAIELIEEANSYTQISSSGTGIHVIVIGALPDDVTTIDDSFPEHDDFPDAEIEVYDNGRFIAMTGDRVEGTPTEVHKREDLLADLADEFDASESSSEDYDHEPTFSKEHTSQVGSTDNMQVLFDAVRNLGLGDYRTRSTVTEKRADGTMSLDPSWADSDSGTRIVYYNDNDGPSFNNRKGDAGFDDDSLVAAEERIISSPSDTLDGEDWWKAIEALRNRGADIPEYDRTTGILNQAAILPDIHHNHEDTDPTITQPDHWDLTCDTIERAIEQEREVVIDAIMSSGKTYGAFKAAFNQDEKIAFFSPREGLYHQAKQYALDNGFDEDEIFIAPSISRDCPTFKGEHGERWQQTIQKQYELGAKAADIHTHNDDIPCECDDDERCNLYQKWNQFDQEQHKVVIGHYKHAFLPQLTIDRTNIFDEDTGSSFNERIEGETLIRGINAFLSMDGSPPIDDFNELLEIRNDEMKKRRAEGWFNNHELGSQAHKVIDNYEHSLSYKTSQALVVLSTISRRNAIKTPCT